MIEMIEMTGMALIKVREILQAFGFFGDLGEPTFFWVHSSAKSKVFMNSSTTMGLVR